MNRPKSILTIGLVAILVAGCATFKDKPISPERTAAAFEARDLADPDLKKFLEANLQRRFNPWPPKSLDLPALTLVALYYHPDMDVARDQWQVAQAGIITAGAIPNPTLSYVFGFASNMDPGANPYLWGLALDIPIETAGKRGKRIAQAKHLSVAARLNIATVAWQVRSRVRNSLVALYAARQREAILRQQQTVQEDQVKLLEKRLTVGEVSQPDVTLAQITLNQTRLALREAQKQTVEGRVQLATALGVPVEALNGVKLSFDFIERFPRKLSLKEAQRQALVNRPDILGALAAYAASQSALQLEIAKQYPDIHFGPSYKFDDTLDKWTPLGISLTLPVFNQNQGPVAEAEARRTETASRFTALQARVIGDIDRNLGGYQAALRKLETGDTLLATQKKQLHSVQAMFDRGEADRLALLGAQLQLEASALSRLDAITTLQQSLGLLEDALMRPLELGMAPPVIPEKRPTAEGNP